jgi:hypothetical protein
VLGGPLRGRNAAAIDLFSDQFLAAQLDGDIELETMLFLICYGLSTNLLFALNRTSCSGRSNKRPSTSMCWRRSTA